MITVAIGGILYVFLGTAPAQAGLFGGAAALLMSLFLKWLVVWLERQMASNRQVNRSLLALFFIPRLILVLAFFSFGIGVLHLAPLPMVATFAVVYMVYWLDWKFSSNEKMEIS